MAIWITRTGIRILHNVSLLYREEIDHIDENERKDGEKSNSHDDPDGTRNGPIRLLLRCSRTVQPSPIQNTCCLKFERE